jgi:hypothetical protein
MQNGTSFDITYILKCSTTNGMLFCNQLNITCTLNIIAKSSWERWFQNVK